MYIILSYFTNLLFPKAAPALLIEVENPTSFLRFFTPHRFKNMIALSTYGVPQVQAAITANKFHHDTHAASLLAGLLTHWLDTLPATDYTIVPIPLSSKRLRERGHNQVTTVTKRAFYKSNITINENILRREKHTEAQSHLDRSGRLSNIKDAFICQPAENINDTCFILLDDVTTTGATFDAALSALRTQFPTNVVICVALAH